MCIRDSSPPVKVHSFSTGTGVGVVVLTTGGGKLDVAVAWTNRVATIDGDGLGVLVGDGLGELVGAGLGVLVGGGLGELVGGGLDVLVAVAVLVGVTVSGTIQSPILLQFNTPSVHEHALQKLSPVSFPDQPLGTFSPPDKVHVRTKVAVLVGVLVAVGGAAVGGTGVAVGAAVGGTDVLVGGTVVGVAVDVGVGVCAPVVKLNVVVSLIPQ